MADPSKNKTARQLIGWREWVVMPDLGVNKLSAKIDTGANSSAIGASKIRQISDSGRPIVEFCLQPGEGGRESEVLCRAPFVGTRIIRSSNGQEEERVVIETRIGLGGKLWKIDLTLTDREAMDFRLLIGRKALGRKFIVNPAAANLLGPG